MTTIFPTALDALGALPRSSCSQPWAVVRVHWWKLTAARFSGASCSADRRPLARRCLGGRSLLPPTLRASPQPVTDWHRGVRALPPWGTALWPRSFPVDQASTETTSSWSCFSCIPHFFIGFSGDHSLHKWSTWEYLPQVLLLGIRPKIPTEPGYGLITEPRVAHDQSWPAEENLRATPAPGPALFWLGWKTKWGHHRSIPVMMAWMKRRGETGEQVENQREVKPDRWSRTEECEALSARPGVQPWS